MQKYDYTIIGTGASGLMLAYYMSMDSYFDDKKILLIDREEKNKNDRTWCYWEDKKGVWDTIVYKEWDQIFFGSKSFSDQISISPYSYKCIRSKDYYEFILPLLEVKPIFTIRKESVLDIKDEGAIVAIDTDSNAYLSDKVFNSVLLNSSYKDQIKYPVLNQHFIGWFVKTKDDFFDEKTATFMDFNVQQKGNTRFMYVLPFSNNEALFEYTLFSKDLLDKEAYEKEIRDYIEALGIIEYDIVEKELGCIPMTCYEFSKYNSKNVLHIGTAGGWTKPSTGFTFQHTQTKVEQLIGFLKNQNDLIKFEKRTKFWYYDLLLLDLLDKENHLGSTLFSRFFKKNKVVNILKFLKEETSFVEDITVMISMPTGKFIKMLWKRIFSLN